MRYVQSLPPIVEPPPDEGAVKAATRAGAVTPVAERSLPPMIYRERAFAAQQHGINRHWAPRADNAMPDRRKFCRRVQHQQRLLELRNGQDRRRHCQRKNDMTTAIDEKI